MNERLMQFRIGMFVMCAGLVLTMMIVWFGESPSILRDQVYLKVHYTEAPGVLEGVPVRKSGIRVGELCGLDLGALDAGRRTVRVLGKGSKERVVPIGVPAVGAVRRWQQAARPLLATARSGPALYLGARGGRLDPRTARRVVHARIAATGSVPDAEIGRAHV